MHVYEQHDTTLHSDIYEIGDFFSFRTLNNQVICSDKTAKIADIVINNYSLKNVIKINSNTNKRIIQLILSKEYGIIEFNDKLNECTWKSLKISNF